MRRKGAWFVVVPLVLASAEGAHALANVVVGESTHELFTSASSGRQALPLAAAALAVSLLAAVAARIRSGHRPALTAAPFALLAPLAFVLLETTESRLAHEALVDRGFVVGVALQLPVALAGYVLARLLLRLADEVGARLCARPARRPHAPVKLVTPLDVALAPAARRGSAHGRAPPPAAIRPG
jgi:hypothetical protein